MTEVLVFLLASASPGAAGTGLPFPNIDPVLLEIGPFKLRWYALAYIAGLLIGARYIVLLVKNQRLWGGKPAPMTVSHAEDFLFWATLGVILGGRLGYVLFYMLPVEAARESLFAAPWRVFAIWEGGMSFHGGLIGVALAVACFARANKIPLLSVGDLAACAAPIGLFFGRIANFINGELWGRPTDLPWGFVFPAAGDGLARHPSQLYEAALEGLALFFIIRFATHRSRALTKPGLAAGLFLFFYGVFRFSVEFVREPDRSMPEALQNYVTMGMLLCLPMIAAGLYLMSRAGKGARPLAPSSA
ncbi:MAG: prolipoprotein diacylglyceryl transferase [Alphaproteobacteria bacterium]|nr:prolipoprotein diacylglyceryl transferase [Alphaproteobacteria bacterium]